MKLTSRIYLSLQLLTFFAAAHRSCTHVRPPRRAGVTSLQCLHADQALLEFAWLRAVESLHKIHCERYPFTMKSALFALAALLVGTASAVELTPDNYDELTAGKTVFIKFLAPW